jgi:hypothetical protein
VYPGQGLQQEYGVEEQMPVPEGTVRYILSYVETKSLFCNVRHYGPTNLF